MNKQAKVIFASFLFFAMFIEINKKENDIPEDLKRLFRTLAKLTRMYEHKLDDVKSEVDEILKDVSVDVDYVLLSVSIIAYYYEQMKGKKRLFSPMRWSSISDLQNECLDMSDKNAKDTFDVAELIVSEILK